MSILAITSMRNEGPHCLEWVAHHLTLGVDHFLVYSNDCDDGTDDMLDLLAATGVVTHERLQKTGARTVQWQGLKHASTHPMFAQADWALVMDCDEFINLRAPQNTLDDLICALPDGTDAVAMAWRLFGHSGYIQMQNQLTTEIFTRAAPENIALPLAHFFKSLFRPAAFRQLGVHRPKRHNDSLPNWVDGAGTPLPDGFSKANQRINLAGLPHKRDLVQLNHYSLRTAENFMVKRARGLPNHMDREIGLGYWTERNFNSVEDTSIHRHLPATKAQLAKLLALSGMAALQEAANANHRAKFNDMMANRDNIQLMWQLGLSAGSTPPHPEFARAQVTRIRKAIEDSENDA